MPPTDGAAGAQITPLVRLDGAAAALTEPPRELPLPQLQPLPLPALAGPHTLAGDMVAEEDALVERLVAFFSARRSLQHPLNALSGAFPLTPLLRQTYGTLRTFVSQPASARRGMRFSMSGKKLLVLQTAAAAAPPLAPAAVDPVEAAYIAGVVELLQKSPGAQLSLPCIGKCFPLPAGFKPRGCRNVLRRHPDKLKVFKPVPRECYFVRLIDAAEAQAAAEPQALPLPPRATPPPFRAAGSTIDARGLMPYHHVPLRCATRTCAGAARTERIIAALPEDLYS